MDKVQKRGFIKYNTPSSEPFRIEKQNSFQIFCFFVSFITTIKHIHTEKLCLKVETYTECYAIDIV
jgi:hypothetical protein